MQLNLSGTKAHTGTFSSFPDSPLACVAVEVIAKTFARSFQCKTLPPLKQTSLVQKQYGSEKFIIQTKRDKLKAFELTLQPGKELKLRAL